MPEPAPALSFEASRAAALPGLVGTGSRRLGHLWVPGRGGGRAGGPRGPGLGSERMSEAPCSPPPIAKREVSGLTRKAGSHSREAPALPVSRLCPAVAAGRTVRQPLELLKSAVRACAVASAPSPAPRRLRRSRGGVDPPVRGWRPAGRKEGPRSVFAEQFELVVNIVTLRFDILLTFDLRKRQFHFIQPHISVPVP